MIKPGLAIIGFLLMFLGLFLGGYLFSGSNHAQALDVNAPPPVNLGSVCEHPRPVIELASRTMAENDSQALRVHLSNPNKNACVVSVTLDAPNFDIGTLGATRSINLPPNSTTSELIWVISPKRTGTFQITVHSGLDTDVAGLTVLNVLGFSPWQIQIFSVISTLFGPMLSIPWWYDRLKKPRSRRRK